MELICSKEAQIFRSYHEKKDETLEKYIMTRMAEGTRGRDRPWRA